VGVLDVTPKLQQYIKIEATKQIKTTTFFEPYSKSEIQREIEEFQIGKAMQDIIVNGPNSPYWRERGYQSRSHAIFAVMCAMYQADMKTSEIINILTNPSYSISEKVCEQKDPVRWLWPQLEKAKQRAK
jgi:hypothetical protein